MSSERPVSLRLDVGQHALSDSNSDTGGTPRQTAGTDQVKAFQAAMTQGAGPTGTDPGPASGLANPAAGIPAIPVPPGLPIGHSGSAGGDQPAARLQHDLCACVERLLVSDDDAHHASVRIDLKDDALPGLSVSVHETEGRLVVCFVCSVDATRRAMEASLDALAHQLAGRLGRDVLMQVQTDDPDDLRLYEILAAPHPS